jgi:antitoxin ParD1/3/4
MPTRNVVLTDHHESVIETMIASGRYQNASEVLREGLRLLEQREAEDAARLQVLRAAARAGFDELDAGRFHTVRDDELEDLIADLARRTGGQAPSSAG